MVITKGSTFTKVLSNGGKLVDNVSNLTSVGGIVNSAYDTGGSLDKLIPDQRRQDRVPPVGPGGPSGPDY
jgi:hypothetical protein